MIRYLYLGRMAYDEALRLQAELVELRIQGLIDNTLLLLEHPPVLTLGRNANRSNVLVTDEMLAARGVTIHEIKRGGDVTYHGPGQLVGYPIFDLRSLRNAKGGRLGPVDFVRLMEEALIRFCGVYGVMAGRICGLTGVWCGLDSAQDSIKDLPQAAAGRKICAIGIHVSRGVVSHGFAFNITTDPRDFTLINPCGITDRPVTSLKLELERVGLQQAVPTLEAAADQVTRQFAQVLGEQVLAVESLAALRGQAALKREIPAEDTPLQTPRELEQLVGTPERPVRA